jgi:hypothetical protein
LAKSHRGVSIRGAFVRRGDREMNPVSDHPQSDGWDLVHCDWELRQREATAPEPSARGWVLRVTSAVRGAAARLCRRAARASQ